MSTDEQREQGRRNHEAAQALRRDSQARLQASLGRLADAMSRHRDRHPQQYRDNAARGRER